MAPHPMNAFKRLPGFTRSMPGLAQRLWRRLPAVLLWGTLVPLGKTHLWDGRARLGLAGDWCLGHRMEDAFVSGLELALAVA